MPVRSIAGTDLAYALVIFDEKGNERAEPDGTFLPADVIRTDVSELLAEFLTAGLVLPDGTYYFVYSQPGSPTIVGGDAVKAILLARETSAPARSTTSMTSSYPAASSSAP